MSKIKKPTKKRPQSFPNRGARPLIRDRGIKRGRESPYRTLTKTVGLRERITRTLLDGTKVTIIPQTIRVFEGDLGRELMLDCEIIITRGKNEEILNYSFEQEDLDEPQGLIFDDSTGNKHVMRIDFVSVTHIHTDNPIIRLRIGKPEVIRAETGSN